MNPGFPTTLEDLAGVVTNVRLTPATVVGGFAENKTVNDGYLVFFDKPAAEVTLGTTKPTYYVRVFALSTADLCKAGEGVIFRNAISVAAVNDVLGTTARTFNVGFVIQ